MSNATIETGNFALVPAPNASERWVRDDGSIAGKVYQRVANGAAIVVDGEVIAEVYTSIEGAKNALDPDYQAALDLAKQRSGAYWS